MSPQPRPRASGVAEMLDRMLAGVVERAAAALVVIEIAVLFAGVVSRYVFRNPLELGAVIFGVG